MVVFALQKPKKSYPKLQENQNRLYLLQQYRACQDPFYPSLQKEQKIRNLPLQSGNQTDPRLDLILTMFTHLVALSVVFYWGSWPLLGQAGHFVVRSLMDWPESRSAPVLVNGPLLLLSADCTMMLLASDMLLNYSNPVISVFHCE